MIWPHPEPSVGPLPAPDYVDRAYDEFVQSNLLLWIRFAHVEVGDRTSAELIALEVAFQLHEAWEEILNERSVPRYTMDLLRAEIVRWRAEHAITDHMVENAAFLCAMRDAKDSFDLLSEAVGAFSAIAGLPERQHQVIVLRYVLGCEVAEVARLMGIHEKTVASHTFYARRTLARELGIALDETEEENRS